MTASTLLSMLASWRDGDCQPEVLCDALSEYGIDPDLKNIDGNTIRDHLKGFKKDGSVLEWEMVYRWLKYRLEWMRDNQK